jgi:hypothetical protein
MTVDADGNDWRYGSPTGPTGDWSGWEADGATVTGPAGYYALQGETGPTGDHRPRVTFILINPGATAEGAIEYESATGPAKPWIQLDLQVTGTMKKNDYVIADARVNVTPSADWAVHGCTGETGSVNELICSGYWLHVYGGLAMSRVKTVQTDRAEGPTGP